MAASKSSAVRESVATTPRPQRIQRDVGFCKFWDAYPRKEAKKKAQQKLRSHLSAEQRAAFSSG